MYRGRAGSGSDDTAEPPRVPSMFPHTLPPLHRPKAHHNHPNPLSIRLSFLGLLSFWGILIITTGPTNLRKEREDKMGQKERD